MTYITKVEEMTYITKAKKMTYITKNPEETSDIAFALAENAAAGEIYCLTGGLGAGKTVFAQGFARGLSVKDAVTSPTFTIINEYKGRLPLYHFDVYRINSVEEMEDTGYEEYFSGNGVCLIEWADLIKELIPDEAVFIKIEKDLEEDENYRRIEINKGGAE